MPEAIIGALFAFCWGLAAASGLLAGAILALLTNLSHRAIAATMSLGAGVLLSIASIKIASEALPLAGAAATVAGIVVGAAMFSIANAVLATAKDRKRFKRLMAVPMFATVAWLLWVLGQQFGLLGAAAGPANSAWQPWSATAVAQARV